MYHVHYTEAQNDNIHTNSSTITNEMYNKLCFFFQEPEENIKLSTQQSYFRNQWEISVSYTTFGKVEPYIPRSSKVQIYTRVKV